MTDFRLSDFLNDSLQVLHLQGVVEATQKLSDERVAEIAVQMETLIRQNAELRRQLCTAGAPPTDSSAITPPVVSEPESDGIAGLADASSVSLRDVVARLTDASTQLMEENRSLHQQLTKRNPVA